MSPQVFRVYDLVDDGTRRRWHLWCGWGGGAGNDGAMIFGGYRRSRLFMAASHALYSLFVRAQGAPGG